MKTWKLKTGSRRDKTISNILRITENLETENCLVLSAVVFTPPTRTRQDSLVLSCPCRRCEQAIIVNIIVTFDFGQFIVLAYKQQKNRILAT